VFDDAAYVATLLHRLYGGPNRKHGSGVTHTALAGWMLAALAKVPRIVGSDTIELIWQSNLAARWRVNAGRLVNAPHGMLAAVRPFPYTADQVDPPEGEPSPTERRLAAI